MNEIKNSSSNRITWLDGIKGISCLFIFFHHFCLLYFPASIYGAEKPTLAYGVDVFLSDSPLGLIINGNFFVHLFILISGYVITHQVIAMKSERFSLFVLKRYLKLLFPIAVYSLFAVLPEIFNCIGQPSFIKSVLKTIYKAVDSLFIGVLIRGNDMNLGGHLWMMNYIFVGSIYVGLIASLCWLYNPKRVIFLPVAIVLLLYFVHTQTSIHFATVFLGCILYLINYTYDVRIPKYCIPVILIICLFFGAFPTIVVPSNIYKYVLLPFDKYNGVSKFIWHSLSVFVIVFCIFHSEKLKSFFSKKLFIQLAGISLWVFLLHGVIISVINHFFELLISNSVNYVVSALIVLILDTIFLILASILFSKFITPLGNKLINSLLNVILYQSENKGPETSNEPVADKL